VKALMQQEEIMEYAAKAKAAGSTRFCMGPARREVRDNRDFRKEVINAAGYFKNYSTF